ncbi:hypothetical protein AVEN_117683-1 [Araneus ventricosus]|uniref:Uncharacterized protein n=1 Tax=Araneus ventricosus TaxID=182803 RepID=A0A4Y2P3B8_ARAVE|nr:hypothetical protein AVEN_117683-1 [Araneus ventricosus]
MGKTNVTIRPVAPKHSFGTTKCPVSERQQPTITISNKRRQKKKEDPTVMSSTPAMTEHALIHVTPIELPTNNDRRNETLGFGRVCLKTHLFDVELVSYARIHHENIEERIGQGTPFLKEMKHYDSLEFASKLTSLT